MTEFKFKIIELNNDLYEYNSYKFVVMANEKLDAFAKVKSYINETYINKNLVKYELLWD